jgi:ribonuclease BN (tRNA processing enzyme)
LIDEILAIDAGCLTSSLSFPAQQKLKAIFITHQHYDHIRDVPAIAMNFYLQGTTLKVYSIHTVYYVLSTHLLNKELYPEFLKNPEENPTIKFTIIEPGKIEHIGGYSILPVLVNHRISAVGYQVTSPEGKSVFYTADTGPGLADCWRHISPDLLITEVTASNRFEKFAQEVGHLTPTLLGKELISFRGLKGYLPPVVAVHMSPGLESEIEVEIAAVAASLNSAISLAHEGMRIHL